MVIYVMTLAIMVLLTWIKPRWGFTVNII